VDCGFAVAVHEEYLEEPGYTDNAELFQEIELPRFPDPAEALRRVLARRLEVYELEVAVKDLFRPEAIEYLAVVYDGVPDVRAVVNVAAEALRAVLADPEGPELVGRPAVRTAYARRQSRGGRSPRQR